MLQRKIQDSHKHVVTLCQGKALNINNNQEGYENRGPARIWNRFRTLQRRHFTSAKEMNSVKTARSQ